MSWPNAIESTQTDDSESDSVLDEVAHVADVPGVVCGDVLDGRQSHLGGELGHVVELARRVAPGLDGARVRALEESRGDRALDHVARDHHERDPGGVELRN